MNWFLGTDKRMRNNRFFLVSQQVRANARDAIRHAPDNSVVTIQGPCRSLEQNALLWALLGKIVKAEPEAFPPTDAEGWKARFLHALGYHCRFETGLDGKPFAVGFRSSKLGVKQMADLIELVYAFGAEHNILMEKETA